MSDAGFLQLLDGSRFTPLACAGTYFQLMDYSAISTDRDSDVAMRWSVPLMTVMWSLNGAIGCRMRDSSQCLPAPVGRQ